MNLYNFLELCIMLIYFAGYDPPSSNNALVEIGKTSGWELALVTAPSNSSKPQVAEANMVRPLFCISN